MAKVGRKAGRSPGERQVVRRGANGLRRGLCIGQISGCAQA